MTAQTVDNTASGPALPQPTGMKFNRLGYHVDSWADLVENRGELVNQVHRNVFTILKHREMPDVTVDRRVGYLGTLSKEKRLHIINHTHPGATTTIYIGKHGRDLFVSWHTYIRPLLNWKLLLLLFGIAMVFGILTGVLFGIIPLAITGIIALIAELSGNEPPPDVFEASAVAASTFSCFCFNTFMFFSFELLGLAFLSALATRNLFTYFFVQPNIFDADDVAAMGIAAHKSLLKGLDGAGIDTDLLRLKQFFNSGRQGQSV
ncbi:MAG TPA: hypothetical protein VMW64_09865 [Dehalococcoidia bacterium]|nr:hypothetical protein [Dehalococcoidia bacterium]